METTVEQLIAERSYKSLNDSEKALVSELCANEQEFNQMKQFFVSITGISSVETYEPSAGLKNSLDSVFGAKHGGIGARLSPREVAAAPVAKVIPFYRQTWVGIAAGIILVAGVFSIWQFAGSSTFESKSETLAKAETNQTSGKPENELMAETAAPVKENDNSEVLERTVFSPPQVTTEKRNTEAQVPEMYDDLLPGSLYAKSDLPESDFSAAPVEETSDVAFGRVGNGRDADLYPDGAKDAEAMNPVSASAVTSSQEDLLSYIVPAF